MTVEDGTMLPEGGRAVALARSLVREQLLAWQLEGLVDTVVLLTSEVVTNAVVHTGRATSVGMVKDGSGVRVRVVDGSPLPPAARRHSTTATTGRGVQLLQALADEWGWEALPEGKAVWFAARSERDPWAAYVGQQWLSDLSDLDA